MAILKTEFFMTPAEAAEHAQAWMQKYTLCAVAVETEPEFELQLLRMPFELGEYIEQKGLPAKICFHLDLPDTHAKNAIVFSLDNPNCLVLDLGKKGEKNLSVSCLHTTANSEASLKIWRKIFSELDEYTKSGMYGMKHGLKTNFPKLRYSPGSAKLNFDGCHLLGYDSLPLWPSE